MDNLFKRGRSLIDKDIVTIKVPFINFNGEEDFGLLQVHKDVSDEVINIFNEIKDIGFPIFKVETVDNYDYDDEKLADANITSSYNFRFVSGSTKLSDHSIGLAIDINPMQNPWVHKSALNKYSYKPGEKGTIESSSEVVNIFKKFGWSWGGDWKNPDYQHFFKSGDINKSIKNKLYIDLGIDNPYQSSNKVFNFKDFIKSVIKR